MVRVGMIGCGGISPVHLKGYEELEKSSKAKLAAVCDIRPEAFTANVAINIGGGGEHYKLDFNTYTDIDEMLKKETLDMIDICLPTYLHADTAVRMLKLGYHVICEKPMAIDYEACLKMLAAAKESGKHLMIGQCLHFFSEYEYLKELMDSGALGKPISAFFQRLSGPPVWAWNNWFMDCTLSGGCIQDMHIHDIDIARYLFGDPVAVSCRTADVYSKWDMASSVLSYPDMTVTAIGDWSLKNRPFEASYRVAFEKGTVEYMGGKITVYPVEGEIYSPRLSQESGYSKEIEYIVDTINNGTENIKNTPESAAESVRLIEMLRLSSNFCGKQIEL